MHLNSVFINQSYATSRRPELDYGVKEKEDMKTPAGFECTYFYGDYFRGRTLEECHLLQTHGQTWSADLCKTCPVPSITRANACSNMVLRAVVTRPFWTAFQRRVQILANCKKTARPVARPHVGCGECHPLPPVFKI